MKNIIRRAFLLFISATMIVSIVASSGTIGTVKAVGTDGTSLIPSPIIRVNNDTELASLIAANYWNGSGSADSPFVIENLEINASHVTNAIYIGNTTANLIIRNCDLSFAGNALPYDAGAAVMLNNVMNAVLENCTCSYSIHGICLNCSSGCTVTSNNYSECVVAIYVNSSDNSKITNNSCGETSGGIYLGYSNDSTIINNTCVVIRSEHSCNGEIWKNTLIGNPNIMPRGIYLDSSANSSVKCNLCGTIDLTQSSGSVVTNNNCSGGHSWGIELESSDGCKVANNSCCNGGGFYGAWGVFLGHCNYDSVENNTFNHNAFGISIEWSKNITVTNNSCNNNSNDGIELSYSNSNVIKYNTCNNNGYFGIYIDVSNNNVIKYDTSSGNANYGIWLNGTANLLYGNTLTNNHGTSDIFDQSRVQAYDEGKNLWNSSSGGNYWCDWTSPDVDHDGIVDSPYAIAGGVNKDCQPMALTAYVTIVSPRNSITTYASTILVVGTANPYCDLEVNGLHVSVKNNGTFSAVISLVVGNNIIEAKSMTVRSDAIASINITYLNEIPILQKEIVDLNDQLNRTTAQLNASLVLVNSSLNRTDENLTKLQQDLDDRIAELSSVKQNLTTTQTNLVTTQNVLNSVRGDPLPLVLSATGLILGIIAVMLIGLQYLRKHGAS